MAVNNTADFEPLVSREQAGNSIGTALRLFVGRGRRYSVKQLSNATGVKDRMIECAMIAPSSPDYRPLPDWALLSIAGFLGAKFTTEWLVLAHQGAFNLPDDEPSPGDLAVANTEDNTTVVRAAVDGHFCADERRELKTVGSRMMTRGAHLVALGGARAA